MKTEFTAGPWFWSPDKWNGGYTGLFAENGDDVVVPQCRNDGDDGAAWFEEINPADASLIAAAPDLYVALEPFAALLQTHNKEGSDHQPIFGINDATITLGDLRKVVAALKKARGEQP